MNDLNRHKKSDKIKWVFTGIAFVLVAVMLIGLCFQVFGNDKLKPSNWFKKTECAHIDENTDGKCDKCGKDIPEETENDNVAVTVPENSGVKLTRTMLTSAQYDEYGIEPQAESAFTITASARDSSNNTSALYQFFDWSMAWKSSNSAAITDYVTMTTTDDTATFSCKKAFSTQIVVTATSVLNKEITATATLDYAKRMTGINFQGTGGVTKMEYETGTSTVANLLNLPNVDTYTNTGSAWYTGKIKFCTSNYIWGTGSIANTVNTSGISVKVEVSAATQTAIKAASGLSTVVFKSATYTGSDVINGITPKTLFTDLAFSSFPSQVHTTLVGRFMTVFGDCSNQLNVTVTVPCTYGGTYTATYALGGDVQSVAISNVVLSGSHVF